MSIFEPKWTKVHEPLLHGYHGLAPLDFKLYLNLRCFVIDDGSGEKRFVFPSQTLLARQIGVSVVSVKRSIKRLCVSGLIKKIPRERKGCVNLYLILDPSEDDRDYQDYLAWDSEYKKTKTSESKSMTSFAKFKLKTGATNPALDDYIKKVQDIKIGALK